jgi:hypothetical protein
MNSISQPENWGAGRCLRKARLRGKRRGNFLQPKAIEVCEEKFGTSDVEEAANITSVSSAGNASFIGKDVAQAFLVSSCSTEADKTPLPGAALRENPNKGRANKWVL